MIKYKTKIEQQGSRNVEVSRRYYDNIAQDPFINYKQLPGFLNKIQYAVGPKHSLGHCLWKECTHDVSRHVSGPYGIFFGRAAYNRHFCQIARPIEAKWSTTAPSGEWDPSCVNGVLDQINLNCSESIMCYSGVLQAIPLVGGALKFSSIMNRAAKKLSKSFKKQPFTTVVKQLIQGDFINRFVVGPMIQDAKMFSDATNYVLRVMNTAYERNAAPTALRSKSVKLLGTESGSGSQEHSNTILRYNWTRVRSITSEAFARVDLHYDVRAISPIKLWATRCGITKPLESVWDLVPFSFVIDYFTRAGDFISGLSEELSSQDGLSGRVTCVHDLWGAYKASDVVTCTGTTYGFNNNNGFTRDCVWQPTKSLVQSYHYTRFPISNPGAFLNSLESSNSLFQSSISLTKLRTIAELIIQAKL